MCVALYTQYFPESCEKKSQSFFYSGGIRTHNLCNSRAVSYQLHYQDCLEAIRILRFSSRYCNDLLEYYYYFYNYYYY